MGVVGVNIVWGTLPYGVKVEGRGEVGGGRSEHWVGYHTAPYPNPTEFKWAIKLIKK